MTTNKHKRQRQGIIPDIIDIDKQQLIDIKTVGYCKSRYNSARFRNATRCGAVEFRARQVHTGCVRAAKNADARYNGHDFNTCGPGPVLKRLTSYGRVQGFAIGAHGECNQDLVDFIKRVAEQGALSRFEVP